MSKTSALTLVVLGTIFGTLLYLAIQYRNHVKKKNGGKTNNPTEGTNEDSTVDDTEMDETLVEASTGDDTLEYNEPDELSFISFTSCGEDDQSSSSCQKTSGTISSTTVYSTSSDDTGIFPVGEISTYGQSENSECFTGWDFDDFLNSPVIDTNMDPRMMRFPTSQQLSEAESTSQNHFEVDVTKYGTIVETYDGIVPPLKPNTGETIRPSRK